ncbi:MAG: beta-lactamase family protein [Actinomycetota bacterium]|nr:beta-lactamase family protein [Actinomycetota bacterium]
MAVAVAAIVAIALMASAASGGERASAGRGGAAKFGPKDIRAFTAAVRSEMAKERIPGVSVGVWVPGRGTWVRSFGIANRGSRARMRSDLHVRIASITKSFVATVVLQLIDRGRLRLDDRLEKFVKGIPNGDDITIRQVLGMTAGIYDYTMDDGFTRRFDRNRLASWSPKQVLAIVKKHGPDFPPGERVSYSDSNYILLGLIIEKLTRRPVQRVIKDQILDRLGMKQTSFPTTPRIPSPFARGYFAGHDGKGRLRDFTAINPNLAWTAGAMISTLRDLRLWARALATGRLLKNATHRAQLKFRQIPNPGGPYIGYGLGTFNLDGFVGHNGAIFGFNSAMFYLPKARATFVVTLNKSTNFSGDATDIFVGIARHLFPGRFSTGS